MTGLVPFAVLVATARTIAGATVVGNNVLAAPVDAIEDLMATHGAEPFIAVYVGHENQRTDGRVLLEGKRRLEISFQIFLPESCTVEIEGQAQQLDTRGVAGPVVFSCIWRQCLRALQDNSTPWSRCWNTFVQGTAEIVSDDFLFEVPGKTKHVAREITLYAETADEPEYGLAEPYAFWADFLALLGADAQYGPKIAALLEAEITAPADMPGWRIAQTSMGVALDTAIALGITPADAAPGGTPVADAEPLDNVTLDRLAPGGAPERTESDGRDDPASFLPPP